MNLSACKCASHEPNILSLMPNLNACGISPGPCKVMPDIRGPHSPWSNPWLIIYACSYRCRYPMSLMGHDDAKVPSKMRLTQSLSAVLYASVFPKPSLQVKLSVRLCTYTAVAMSCQNLKISWGALSGFPQDDHNAAKRVEKISHPFICLIHVEQKEKVKL